MPLQFSDVLPARRVVYRTLKPTPLLQHPLLRSNRSRSVREARESQSDERLQGARRPESGWQLARRRTARRHDREHRQSRPVDRARVPARARAVHGRSCRKATIPTRTPPCAHWGRRCSKTAATSTRRASTSKRCTRERGLRYVHSANEPMLIAGVATYALEIFEELPDVDVILVPIGGGSGACGCALVRTWTGSRARIIGVQAAGADAFARSWRVGTRVVGDKIGDVRRRHGHAGHVRSHVRDPASSTWTMWSR